MLETKRIQPSGNFRDSSGGGAVTRKLIVSISPIVLGICQLAAAGGISFKPVHTYAVDNPAWVVAGQADTTAFAVDHLYRYVGA